MSTKGKAESFVEMRGALNIPDMITGKSAYEIAVMHGFHGTEEEWIKWQTIEADRSEAAANRASESANAAKNEADRATEAANNAESNVQTALTQAKASGEFDGADGKSAYKYAQDGGYAGTEKQFAAKLAVPFAIPQMFGAKGDGITDDTAAIQAALTTSNSVFVPEGRYVIKGVIQIEQGKTLCGAGEKSVLICNTSSDFVRLSAFTSLNNLNIEVQYSAGNLISINEPSLANASGLKSGNINITIDGLKIKYDGGDYTDCSVFDLSLTGAFGSRTGYYGVSISNIHVWGTETLGYFLRGYTKNSCWITGITVRDCVVINCRWGIFMHDSDSDFTNLSETKGIDELAVIRYQHQCGTATKGFFFLRKETNAQFTDCVPWDWHYAQGNYYKRPYWFAYDRLANVNAKIDINDGNLNGTKFGFAYADGTAKMLNNYDQYTILHNIGVKDILVDSLPKQMHLGESEVKATCVFKTENSSDLSKILQGGTYFYLRFKLVDSHYMSEDITVHLHPTMPYIVANRWNTKHKIGYTLKDNVFKVYIYTTGNFKYSYVVSEAISNDSMGYSGVSPNSNYNNTINTFDVPVAERYLTAVPDGIVEISDVRAILGDYVTATELDNKGYVTTKELEDVVRTSEALTLVGVDASGNSHTWTVYGKVVS